MASALGITATSPDVHQLYVDLKAAGDGVQIELRRGMNKAAAPLSDSVKRAAAWSSRIPSAVRVKTSFSAKSAGVSVVVNSAKAPEARPLEHGGNSGTFRHPVFGHDWWQPQDAHPFFWQGIKNADPAVGAAVQGVLDGIAARQGFH